MFEDYLLIFILIIFGFIVGYLFNDDNEVYNRISSSEERIEHLEVKSHYHLEDFKRSFLVESYLLKAEDFLRTNNMEYTDLELTCTAMTMYVLDNQKKGLK